MELDQEKLLNQITKIRRDLHQFPEIALEEYKTSEYIAKALEAAAIETKRQVAGTGVVGTIYGKRPGKTIAIRADMDALNIEEKNEVSYKSVYPGLMHACGHDGHIAMAIGAAIVLNKIKERLEGNIKFIFQPAEEQYGGAERMIKEKVLEAPQADAIIALHLWPDIPKGSIGIKEGGIMASNDRLEIKIFGKSAHGAMPHLGRDAIVIGTQIISAVQSFIAREINPIDSAVITIGTFNAGTAYNIVANEAVLTGTVRAIDNKTRNMIEDRLRKIVEGICLASDSSFQFNYIRQYPATINNPVITSLVKQSAMDIMGKDKVVTLSKPYMTAEDFAFYLEKIPGCMCFIGTGDDQYNYPLHHERFNFDEKVLEYGVRLLADAAIRFLSQKG